LPPLRTISTTETEGFEKRKNIFLERLARIKKMLTFAPPLRTLRGSELRVESLERGIEKKSFKKACQNKKDAYLCTPLNNGKPARER
jgi:hypothetical protein